MTGFFGGEYMSDKVILYHSLKRACRALHEEQDDKRYQHIIETAAQQFAKPHKQRQLVNEIDEFCQIIVEELAETNSWYYLDDHLNNYYHFWQTDQLI